MKTLLTLMFCLITTLAFATTRQEIQVAQDFIRFVNIANDLVYVATSVAKGEIKVDVFDENNQIIDKRDMTIDEIKNKIKRIGLNIKGYRNLIDNFLSIPSNTTMALNGLNALSVDIQDMKNDILLIDNTITNIISTLSSIETMEQLNQIATDIENAITPLPLIRKATCVGYN